MHMSKAAIAPKSPIINESDRKHPLFRLYDQHRRSCANNLISCEQFSDWLFTYERNLMLTKWTEHAEYRNFIAWMKANQGGARPCPVGVFPHNFEYWIAGGRW